MTGVELILARNLVSSLELAAILMDEQQSIVFFNESAGNLVGARFEETGPMSQEEWRARFGPLDDDGTPVPVEQLPLVDELRDGRPGHARVRLRTEGGDMAVEASALPLTGPTGYHGALIALWPEHSATGRAES